MTKNVTENKGGLTGDQRAGNPYQSTVYGCFAGYIVQAIVNNFAPLLFLTFQSEYRIGLEKITLLITLNFCTQLIVDLVSVKFVDRIGYRISLILAHGFAAAGLAGLAFLPDLLADPFAGLAVCAAVYAVGGGLLEVLVSPVVEACPSDRKEAAMSLLHSFYCWGQVGVVLISTLYFALAGVGRWRALALIWALVPLGNGIRFFRLPLPRELTAQEKGISLGELLGRRLLWILLLMMACAGACELGISQWASAFAERGLGVGKTAGDLAGPMLFALLMGSARAWYGKCGAGIRLEKFMAVCGVLCLVSYGLAALSPWPAVSLAGCGLCGLSVGILWPGTFSLAAARLKGGGTALFALLALAGDLGCTGGPALIGLVSDALGENLKGGILAGTIFPAILLAALFFYRREGRRASLAGAGPEGA